MQILVAGAGIVGISTAIWLQRAGHEVTVVDREGPASGTSYGNAGVLAAAAIVPVPVPGIMRKAPGMLMDRNAPLFLRWSYLPKLLPFLRKYLSYATDAHVDHYAKAMSALLHDTVEQHQALAADTPAAQFIKTDDYCFGYASRAEFDADSYGWGKRDAQNTPTMTRSSATHLKRLYGARITAASPTLAHMCKHSRITLFNKAAPCTSQK